MNTTFDRHAQCLSRLPAFVGGRLSSVDASAVIAHTRECRECRAELDIARRVHAHFARDWRRVAPLLDHDREEEGFDQLWARITADDTPAAPQRHRWNRASRLTALAATLLFAAGYVWFGAANAPQYHTLADPTSQGCVALHVRFAGQIAPADGRVRLESAGAQIVDGPDASGLYTLRAADPAEALRQLRALPDVAVAEPADC